MTDTFFFVDKAKKQQKKLSQGMSIEYNYHFYADGHRYQLIDKELDVLYERIIKQSEYELGEEVYLIHYNEGLNASYTLGWLVIFDVERLYSEVFHKHESIITAIGDDVEKLDIIQRFLDILKEKNIRYGEEFINMD